MTIFGLKMNHLATPARRPMGPPKFVQFFFDLAASTTFE
jgi:hypothetical protein